jgi:hypothetical protein
MSRALSDGKIAALAGVIPQSPALTFDPENGYGVQ